MTVVIHGPRGCGKTKHAEAFARRFGCTQIVDDWDGVSELPLDALALTNAASIRPPADARVISFAVADWHLRMAAGAMCAGADVTREGVALSDPQSAQSLSQEIWQLYQSWCRRLRQLADQDPQGSAKTAAPDPAASSAQVQG